MKKAYWLAPLAVLIAFVFIYMQSRHDFEAKIEAEKKAKQLEIQHRNEENERRNKEAMEQRRIATEKKKEEDAKEAAQKAAEAKYLTEIEYARDFANREAVRYENVVKELDESFKTEKKAREAALKTIESMRDEKKFIVDYVAKAQANESSLKELLEKLSKLEADRAKVAAKQD